MSKYQILIEKIKNSTTHFTPFEITLLKEALETIEFLEIFFKERKIKQEKYEPTNL
jgi:hypothetical protein